MGRQRHRPLGHEVQRLGRILARRRLGIAAAVGEFPGPALVGIGQRRRGGGQRFGGIARRFDRGRVLFRGRTVVGRGLLQQGVLFQLLLDEGRQLEMRELQQLDGLLQLRRHRQGLARRQDETGTNTHLYPHPEGLQDLQQG